MCLLVLFNVPCVIINISCFVIHLYLYLIGGAWFFLEHFLVSYFIEALNLFTYYLFFFFFYFKLHVPENILIIRYKFDLFYFRLKIGQVV
mmetsp:Transcript_110/g.19  ORF Transcript_110/g.19 Transcript_110/m.19 type:complete len:90 (+) Transcript_110:211-480(+)